MMSLQEVVFQNSIQEVKRLIDKGIDVNEEALNFQVIPLHIAAYKGHEEIAKLLISNGADINAKAITGNTALHLATQNNNFNIVRLLLAYKANINEIGDESETALHIMI